jgi:hypothetical protein
MSLSAPGVLTMDGFFQTETKGSFITYTDNRLWVGEFTRSNGTYSVPKSHHRQTGSGTVNFGWLGGYSLDPETGLIRTDQIHDGTAYPDMILSIPHEIQGAAFTDGVIVFSRSFGRRNRSHISVYRNPMGEKSDDHFTAPSGQTVPVWILDNTHLKSQITAPPMSEGLTLVGPDVWVLFESGSDKYRKSALDPLDRIQILNLY